MPDGAAAGAPLLGVGRSFTGRCWRARPVRDDLVRDLCRAHDLPDLVGRVLAGRGVTPDTASDFLAPTLRSLLPDPSHLRDMDAAAGRLARAIMAGEPVAVFGDYDVDGATSAALLCRFFRAAGAELVIYIPDRLAEGYGPNAPALARLHDAGIRLVVTVDCGVTAFEPLAAAAASGQEVIVIDHHAAEPELPPALAVVNPNRRDETTPHRNLAAVGVTFLLVVAVNRALRAAGWYRDRAEPDLLGWLDLVALGTACDVVPLTGLNRALVTQGLKVLARRGNPGLAALAEAAGLKEGPLDAYHLGFVLGPRVNAGGRVGAADLGARLLATDDPAEARDLAQRLDAYNGERRLVEAGVLEAALAQATADAEAGAPLVLAVGEGWHPGVIGIVAARLKERFHRPACVVALEDGVGRASGRSVRGLDLGAAVLAARREGLLLAGGGHAMAAGFTVARDGLDPLRRFLTEHLARQQGGAPLTPAVELDGLLALGGATAELAERLAGLGPFGSGNAEPRFAIPDVRLVRAEVVGERHVRGFLSGPGGGWLKAVAFRALDTALGPALLQAGDRPVHVCGHLRPNRWNGGGGVQFLVEDAAPAWAGG